MVDDAALAGGHRPEAAGPHLLSSSTGWPTGLGPWAGGARGHRAAGRGAAPGRRPAPSVVRLRLGPATGVERVPDGEPPVPIGRPGRLPAARPRPWPGGWRATARRGRRRSRRARCARAARPAGLRPGPAGIRAVRARWEAAAVDRLRVPDRRRRSRGSGSCSTSRSPRRAAADRTGSASGPPVPGRASCCAPWWSGWPPRTRREALNLVLVDFKGGATFLGLAAHAARLRGDHQPGRRAHAGRPDGRCAGRARSCAGRRSCGRPATWPSVTDYAAARRARAELPPLPALLVWSTSSPSCSPSAPS